MYSPVLQRHWHWCPAVVGLDLQVQWLAAAAAVALEPVVAVVVVVA